MRFLRIVLGKRLSRRGYGMIAATAMLAIGFGPMLASADAATPASTDVMLLFDTSGSMGSVLTEAKTEIEGVENHVRSTLPDVQFGVSEVRDFFPSTYDSGSGSIVDFPWKLDQAITSDNTAVQKAVSGLELGYGGDLPESYGRALWEADTNPTVGWRAGARHIIILVADDVPHDDNLNEGVAEAKWVTSPTFNTGEELEGAWGITGTQWTAAVNRNFQSTLTELANDGKPLGMVDFRGEESGYLPYWEYWAGLTGGQAVQGGSAELAAKLTSLIESRATSALAPCPAGQVRNASEVCVTPHPTVTQVICNLVIATASDTCTATVADAAPTGATNPTGTVAFTSANGGVFSAGSSCTLVSTPLSSNVSSCSVQFLPPSAPSSLPAITGAYSGDAVRLASSGSTHYGPASELALHVKLSELGTINGANAEVPIECAFPCETGGEAFNEPGLAHLTAFGSPSVESTVLALSAAHGKTHGKKKKKKKPILLGKGKVRLSKPGKGKLVIKLSHKASKALSHVSAKGVKITVKITVKTLNGTVVTTKSQRVKLRPKAKKKAKKHAKHH